MFQGEKTAIFWVGLIILAFASLAIFSAIWGAITNYIIYASYRDSFSVSYLVSTMPVVVGGAIFIAVGTYMMKSGIKKKQIIQ